MTVRIVAALVSVLWLAGCASSGVVQLYEGEPRADSQVLTVKVPASLEVARINDQEVSGVNTFVGSNDRVLKMAPGRYEMVAYYRSVWTVDGDRHHTLASEPVRFVVDGTAGERYRLSYNEPANLGQAQVLIKDFSGWVENLDSGEQTPSSDSDYQLRRGLLASSLSVERKSAGPQATLSPQATVMPVSTSQSQTQASNTSPSYLDTLKAQWQRATEEERRAFLQWIAE